MFYLHTCLCLLLSTVIRDSGLCLLVQSHSHSAFQDTWVTLNLTNYSVMVSYRNLACIWTDILYPRPSGRSVLKDVGAIANQSSRVLFSNSEFLYPLGDGHFFTGPGKYLSLTIPGCFSGFLNSFRSHHPTHTFAPTCAAASRLRTHCCSAGWLSYCTHHLQNAPGSSPTGFSPTTSPELHRTQAFRLFFSLCHCFLLLKPTLLPSASDGNLIDCSIKPPVVWLFLFKCCSENESLSGW